MTVSPGSSRQPSATWTRPYAIFAVVAMALLMSSIDGTIVATALHAIQHGLDTTINWASWTITAYSLGLVLMLTVAGKLSDLVGRRRFFLVSVLVFTTTSLCCGLTGNIYLLIVLRFIQAAGGAGFTPSATSIVVDHFGDRRDKALGLFGSIFPIGGLVGPIFGGLFVTYWSWRGIFLINVPIGTLLTVLCLVFIPRDPQRDALASRRMDPGGLALLGVGVLGAMLSITYLGEPGAQVLSPLFVVPALVAIVALWLFVRHIGRVAEPFIQPRLVRGRGFAAINFITLLYGGAVSGLAALVPLYATTRYGMDALRSGSLLTAEGLAAIVLSILASFLLRRTGYRLPLYTGGALMAAGMLMLATEPLVAAPYVWLAAATCLIGIGAGWSSPANRNACMQLAPDQSAPLAAVRSTARQVGQISAVSITTAILAQSADPGALQSHVFAVFALLLLAWLPLIARVQEHRGAW